MSRLSASSLCLLAGFVLECSSAAAGGIPDVIRILPGPVDGAKIQTPWGDYIAVQTGSTVWVGTQAEYDAALNQSFLNGSGFRELRNSGAPPNEHYEVDRRFPSMTIGGMDIAQIQTDILFGVTETSPIRRPHKAPGDVYVALTWIQSGKRDVIAALYQPNTRKTYHPISLDRPFEHFRSYEFTIPKADLAKQFLLIANGGRAKPGGVSFPSLTSSTRQQVCMTSNDLPLGAEQLTELRQLHELDSAIPDRC